MKKGTRCPHTPAPWTIMGNHIIGPPRRHDVQPRQKKPSEVVAIVPNCKYGDYVYYPELIAAANRELISAAPDLLEACKYVVKWHREHDSGEGELFGLDFVTTCIAAIRKAEESA